MSDEDIARLIHRESFLNYCFHRNEDDIEYWKNWLRSHPEHAEDVAALKEQLIMMAQASEEKVKRQHFAELQEKIAHTRVPAKRVIPLWPRIAAAASVVLLLSAGTYWLLHKKQVPQQVVQTTVKEDIGPGGNKAVLTLDGGKQVVLTGAANGTVAQQGSVLISKTDEGKIAYTGTGNRAEAAALNTITTPRGGKWFVTLSDGTKVWLNSISSLRFPTQFTGADRNVEVTGEAYFEVAKNEKAPFYVGVGEMSVRVLGTHFNINAYSDEDMVRTTLLEGRIEVSSGENKVVLKPGQQAVLQTSNHKLQTLNKVVVDQVVAWKNGFFYFDGADVKTVMTILSKWYDIDVSYHGNIPQREFVGQMERNLTLSQVLNLLSQNEINYKIEGRKLIIGPPAN